MWLLDAIAATAARWLLFVAERSSERRRAWRPRRRPLGIAGSRPFWVIALRKCDRRGAGTPDQMPRFGPRAPDGRVSSRSPRSASIVTVSRGAVCRSGTVVVLVRRRLGLGRDCAYLCGRRALAARLVWLSAVAAAGLPPARPVSSCVEWSLRVGARRGSCSRSAAGRLRLVAARPGSWRAGRSFA